MKKLILTTVAALILSTTIAAPFRTVIVQAKGVRYELSRSDAQRVKAMYHNAAISEALDNLQTIRNNDTADRIVRACNLLNIKHK